MAQKTISSSDSGSVAAGKINDNFTELYAGAGGGGSAAGIIARNQDAVNRIYAAKRHFDVDHEGSWTVYNHADNFCIAHASDFHVDVTRLANFRDFVDGIEQIDAAVISGDITSNGTDTEFSAVGGVEFDRIQPLKCIGNHERWGGKTLAQIVTGLGMTSDYYKVDYATPKIRIIVLNRYDVSNTTKAVAALDGHFSSTQINWFIGQLDDAITNNYNVIVMMHSIDSRTGSGKTPIPASNNKGFFQRFFQWESLSECVASDTIIEDIIHAFRNKTTVNKTYTYSGNNASSVSVNHTFSGNGKFICYLVGHTHIDVIGYSQNHPDQLVLAAPVAACLGIDVNDQAHPNDHQYGIQIADTPRVPGTKTEDCFNVYGFDLTNKIVKVVRVGSDMNDLMEKREVAYFEYQPSVS